MKIHSLTILECSGWTDYALLDSGDGLKLERFGAYVLVRPEPQAMWRPALQETEWQQAHAVFQPSGEESGGHWKFNRKLEQPWLLSYDLGKVAQGQGKTRAGTSKLKFGVMTTPGRHLGVFPESASHWEWIYRVISDRLAGFEQAGAADEYRGAHVEARPKSADAIRVLNLFGYTGLSTLAASAAGAGVTHVDASTKSVRWARENQALTGLSDKPIRWIVEDAVKYVQRESRRGVKYDGIILDPPKFGRGPKGEVWELFESLPALLAACRSCLSERPLFVVISVYGVRVSAIHLAQSLEELLPGRDGNLESGELATRDQAAGRLLSQAVFARWQA